MAKSSQAKARSPLGGLNAGERAWLTSLTATITGVTRTTHSMRLYDAMGERAGLGIRPYLFGVLTRIKELQPVRVSDVADEMDYDRSTVSRHVAELVSLDCVLRNQDEVDGRAVILELTPKGETAVAEVFGAWMEFLHGMVEGWTPDERDQFLTLLTRFSDSMEQRVADL